MTNLARGNLVAIAAAALAAMPLGNAVALALGKRPAASAVVGRAALRSKIAAPSRTRGATVVGVVAPVPAWAQPGAGRKIWTVGTQTSWSAQPQVLLALASAVHAGQGWVKVLLPIRPDGSAGWIPLNDVSLSFTHYWVVVDKQTRDVRVYRRGKLLRTFKAVIGKPATPTPDGLAAVYEVDRQPNPGGFLGTWALPLTILSNTLENFGGGPGRIAIHGRGGASLQDPLGSASSHGCIRIDNSEVAWLAGTVRQGTPVQISG